jgi:hypothetical protein
MPNPLCESRNPPADPSRDGRRCLKRCAPPKTRKSATQRCVRPREAGTGKYVYSADEIRAKRAACPNGMSDKTKQCFKTACKIGTSRWQPTGRCRRIQINPRRVDDFSNMQDQVDDAVDLDMLGVFT